MTAGDVEFIQELETRSMSSWSDAELAKYAVLTGQTQHCDECNQAKPAHEFYTQEGKLAIAVHVATNSNSSWRKRMCYQCWNKFTNETFCIVEREGNTFTAISAF